MAAKRWRARGGGGGGGGGISRIDFAPIGGLNCGTRGHPSVSESRKQQQQQQQNDDGDDARRVTNERRKMDDCLVC